MFFEQIPVPVQNFFDKKGVELLTLVGKDGIGFR